MPPDAASRLATSRKQGRRRTLLLVTLLGVMLAAAAGFGHLVRRATPALLDVERSGGGWTVTMPAGWASDVTEYADGLVVAATQEGTPVQIVVVARRLVEGAAPPTSEALLREAARRGGFGEGLTVTPRLVDAARRAEVAGETGRIAVYGYTLDEGLVGGPGGELASFYRTIAAATVEGHAVTVEVMRAGRSDGRDAALVRAIAASVRRTPG